MREDQRLDKPQWNESGRSFARRVAAVSAAEQISDDHDRLNEAPNLLHNCEICNCPTFYPGTCVDCDRELQARIGA